MWFPFKFSRKKSKAEFIDNPEILKVTSKMTEIIPAEKASCGSSICYDVDTFLKVMDMKHIVRIHKVIYLDERVLFFAFDPENGVMMYTFMVNKVKKA
jgi:hypothetical protein